MGERLDFLTSKVLPLLRSFDSELSRSQMPRLARAFAEVFCSVLWESLSCCGLNSALLFQALHYTQITCNQVLQAQKECKEMQFCHFQRQTTLLSFQKLLCLNEHSITEPPNSAFTVCSCTMLLSELIMQHLHEEKPEMDASQERKEKGALSKGRLLYLTLPKLLESFHVQTVWMAVPSWDSHGKEEVDMFEK